MSRLNRMLLAVALVACATVARAETLRLLAPANGSTLRGGSLAELHWSAAPLPQGAEEWEAFLSVDGGKYYAFRVTPHLDIELRRFTFVVPNVDTHDARVLIRTGDEERETKFEARGSFSIERDPNAGLVIPNLLQFGRGEAAREGDPAVLSWTDGPRNGSETTQQSSTNIPAPSFRPIATEVADATPLLVPAATCVTAPSIAKTRLPGGGTQARKTETLPGSVDLLLVCRRRNI
jgi:hypothetical protein